MDLRFNHTTKRCKNFKNWLNFDLSGNTPQINFMNVFGLFAKPFLVCLHCKVTSLIFE